MKPSTLFFYFLCTHFSLLRVSGSKVIDLERDIKRELHTYEIVEPQLHKHGRWRRDISTRSISGGHLRRLTLSLRGFGRDFILDVAQNRRLLSANYTSRYFNADGSEIISKIKNHDDNCFYQGTVQGLMHSVVAISTCQGIEGMIFDGNETYYIHPASSNTEDKHIMYCPKDMRVTKKNCGVKHSGFSPAVDELLLNHKHIRSRRNVESETKFVELLMVNDYSQFVYLKRSISAVELRAKTIANLVDSLYRPLHVRIALTMVETWNQRDLVQIVESSDQTLDNFMTYRNKDLVSKYKHDNAQLITHKSFSGSTVGKAAVMAMCTRRSGGVVQDHTSTAAGTAATLAHEMGHNFGMIHDEDVSDCKCDSVADSQGCIMSAVAKNEPSTEWSSCSIQSFDKMLKRGLDSCLFNTPPTLFGDAICGNGFKEEGEECDCGTIEECLKYGDNCCNATTCKLHADSECDEGPCCAGCKLKSQGSPCREKVNECDLPEFCTGKSELCPSNKYVQDGTPCGNNKGYCYKSECPLHDQQCQDVWGPDALSGPEECYETNKKGSVRGNCRAVKDTYEKCAAEDVMCGMLQCENNGENSLPIIGSERNSYPYTIYLKDGKIQSCASASLTIGLDVPDPGQTVEGTKCGEHKLCIDRKCSSIESFTSGLPSCPNNCSNENGICNNEGECFCYSCWQGDDCSTWVECKGKGAPEPETKRSNLAGILIAVFLVIFLVIGAVFAFIYRDQLLQKWHAYKKKSPAGKRYHGVSTSTPERSKDRKATGAANTTSSEPPKPRPTISGPTLNSSTRTEPTVTITPNPLGSTKFSSGAAKQDQPHVALKPVPPKPVKPEPASLAKEPRPPPPRDWPPLRTDKKLRSLNRASSPPGVGEPVKPVKPVKPRRPESHAGVLEKDPLPPPPAKKSPAKWPPEDHKQDADRTQPKKALKPPTKRNESRFPRTQSEDRPTSLPLKPSDIKKGLGKDRPFSAAPKAASSQEGPVKRPPMPFGPRPGSKPPSS